ncbi:MAG TPA: hypothetical protein VHW45_20175 [Candidatus Sulfotelmatobacter sp.]|nr:hypothetical protein [Candidatus Sulfotelmatobacter sp.]
MSEVFLADLQFCSTSSITGKKYASERMVPSGAAPAARMRRRVAASTNAFLHAEGGGGNSRNLFTPGDLLCIGAQGPFHLSPGGQKIALTLGPRPLAQRRSTWRPAIPKGDKTLSSMPNRHFHKSLWDSQVFLRLLTEIL